MKRWSKRPAPKKREALVKFPVKGTKNCRRLQCLLYATGGVRMDGGPISYSAIELEIGTWVRSTIHERGQKSEGGYSRQF